jgi:flavodoxin
VNENRGGEKRSTPARAAAPTPYRQSSLESFFSRFRIRMHLWIDRVSHFGGLYFHGKFLDRFNNSYKLALQETQIQFLDIFIKSSQTGSRIIQRLDRQKPLYYELIEMMSNVYDKMIVDQVTDHYINFPDVPKKMSELKDPLMDLYRRLFLLRPYENTLFNSYLKAIDLQQGLDESRAGGAAAGKKRIKSALYIVFHKLYPRLHWLFCYYQDRYIFIDDKNEIEDILNISASEKPGNRVLRKAGGYSEEAPQEGGSAEEAGREEKEAAPEIPDEVRKGLKIMYSLDLREMRRQFDRKGDFEFMSDNDKVLMTFLLFHEFEAQYSFLLTTNKIKFKIDLNEQGKINFGTRLQDLYDLMRKPKEGLRDYSELLVNSDKIRREKPINNSQYIAYTKRVQEIQKKRDQAGKLARQQVRAYMEKLGEELKTLIDDMNSRQEYVQNPQDVLNLDISIEGRKKLNGRKIYEAILLLYYFSSAFVYRLGPGGDLTGTFEYAEADGNRIRKSLSDQDGSAVNPLEGFNGSQDLEPQDESKSILDELDDML